MKIREGRNVNVTTVGIPSPHAESKAKPFLPNDLGLSLLHNISSALCCDDMKSMEQVKKEVCVLWNAYEAKSSTGVALDDVKALLDLLLLLSTEKYDAEPFARHLIHHLLIQVRKGIRISKVTQQLDQSPLIHAFHSIGVLVSQGPPHLSSLAQEVTTRLLESYSLEVSFPIPPTGETLSTVAQLPKEAFFAAIEKSELLETIIQVVSDKPHHNHVQLLDLLFHSMVQSDSLFQLVVQSPLAHILLASLSYDVGSVKRKALLSRKIRILLKVLNEGVPPMQEESVGTLLSALLTQMEVSTGKEMANIRNDLATILLLIVQGQRKDDLRKALGDFAPRIGAFVSENVVGVALPEFPLQSRPQDFQLLEIFLRTLRLLLPAQHLPHKLIANCCLVECGLCVLIGPCPLLDSLPSEGLLHSAWELLHQMAILSATSFEREEGVGAMLSYLHVFAFSDLQNVDMGILAFVLDVLRTLLKNKGIRKYVNGKDCVKILIGVVGKLSGSHWDAGEDVLMANALLSLAAIGRDNESEQQLFHEANGVKTLLRLLNRLIYAPPTKKHDVPVVAMSLCECVWRCLGSSATSLETWLGFEGILRLLDFLEVTKSPGVQLKLLSGILDLTEYPRCLDQLLYWKRRKADVRDHEDTFSSSLRHERGIGIGSETADMTLGSLLAELWRQEESLLGVSRKEHGLIDNLEHPLLSEWGREWGGGGSPATLDLLYSLRPKIYLLAKRITEVTNTEATLFGGLSLKNQVTMELIINMLDLKRGEMWLESAEELMTTQLPESDALALDTYTKVSKNKVLAVVDTQQFLISRHQEQKFQEEKELNLQIRQSHLQEHLRGVREAEEIARTSNYTLLVDKRLWQRAQLAKARKDSASFARDARLHLTTNQTLNVTPWLGRSKVIRSEEPGFEEEVEGEVEHVAGGEGQEKPVNEQESSLTLPVPPTGIQSHVHFPSEAMSTDDYLGVSATEEGFYEVNPIVLAKGLVAALNDDRKWDWRNSEASWSLRTKWKSTWYH